jgi:hypothetical protein
MAGANTTHLDIIKNIQSLQSIEKHLYSNLHSAGAGEDAAVQQQVIDKINSVSESRIGLFKSLAGVYSLLTDNVSLEKDDIKTKMQFLQNNERELNRMKNQANKAKGGNINDLRMIEINTYYSDKYGSYLRVFQYIVAICIGIFIITILRQRYLITSKIANLISIIIIVSGLFFIIPLLFDLSARNNMVFNEYDFGLGIKKSGGGETDSLARAARLEELRLANEAKKYEGDLALLEHGTCLGPRCCTGPGLSYDNKNNICIASSSSASSSLASSTLPKSSDKETFISGQSTQTPGSLLRDDLTIIRPMVNTDMSGTYYSIN